MPHTSGRLLEQFRPIMVLGSVFRAAVLSIQGQRNLENIHPDVGIAMKAGAGEFLTKPFRDRELLDAIHKAIQRDYANRKQAEIAEQRARYDSLTQREREVLGLVVTGLLNKQIGREVGYHRIYSRNPT